jgi:hypothetical protein
MPKAVGREVNLREDDMTEQQFVGGLFDAPNTHNYKSIFKDENELWEKKKREYPLSPSGEKD